MPRCISSTSPEDRSASRYLARRPRPVTVWPSSRLTKSFGSGQRRSPRAPRPWRSARPPSPAQAAAHGFDFGKFGHAVDRSLQPLLAEGDAVVERIDHVSSVMPHSCCCSPGDCAVFLVVQLAMQLATPSYRHRRRAGRAVAVMFAQMSTSRPRNLHVDRRIGSKRCSQSTLQPRKSNRTRGLSSEKSEIGRAPNRCHGSLRVNHAVLCSAARRRAIVGQGRHAESSRQPISATARCRSATSRRWSTTCSTASRARYDLMNDLMSGGLHRAWKDALVTARQPAARTRPFALLDLAGGTGDVAFRVVAAGGAGTRVDRRPTSTPTCSRSAASAPTHGLDDAIDLRRRPTPRRCRSPTAASTP